MGQRRPVRIVALEPARGRYRHEAGRLWDEREAT